MVYGVGMTQTAGTPTKQMLSERVHARLREAIMRGAYAPSQALKPQELAQQHQVSLAVVREALVGL
ncbi:GntR family transcriptional regulator, partial [Nonomuraea sp. NPDC049784]|uniref:GntR family transcriptional regulator n=1 Tax=Nonomuraea sp. NPDC049784 TaxID=3154361 RepID=UPI0033F0DB27